MLICKKAEDGVDAGVKGPMANFETILFFLREYSVVKPCEICRSLFIINLQLHLTWQSSTEELFNIARM